MNAPLALLLVVAAQGANAPRSPTKPAPPNVLLILCDDLGYGDLGCYGHPVIQTPRIDALAAGGVRFTQFYAAAPVCSPSRAGLLTGRAPGRAGVYDWIPEGSPVHLRRGETTLPGLLRGRGYRTGHFGKWHLNGLFDDPAQPQPGDHGFDAWFATQNNAVPSHRDPVNFVRDAEPVGPLEGYSCDLVAAEAVRWLDESAADDKPFFLNVWLHEPHLPIASPPALVEKYLPHARTREEAEYFANVANVDGAVGMLLDALEERGFSDDTVVVFTSDNGPEDRFRYPAAAKAYGVTGSLRGRKLWLYEGGVRVPGVVRWPGRIDPRIDDTPVGAVDLLPTLCRLAGVADGKIPPLDGTDLSDLLLHGAAPERATPLFWLYFWGRGGPVAAVRDGRHVLLGRRDSPADRLGANLNPRSQAALRAETLGRFELYDLAADPAQSRDLAPDRPHVAADMAATLTRLHREVRDGGPDWFADGPAGE